jgi:transcriptional regulator with XRE-family HTH domain
MARTRVMKIDNPGALGRRLASARAERGLTLRELAFEGCSAAYVSTIESGKRTPSLQVLQALAERLGVGVDYLATGERAPIDIQLNDAEVAVHLEQYTEAREKLVELRPRLHGRQLARGLALHGVLEVQEGNLSQGVELLEQAREADPKEFMGIATAIEALGRTYATQGKYESAVELFTDARDAAAAAGDRPRALKSTVLLANTYIDLGDVGHSTTALADALRDAIALRDPMLRATVLWSQARLHTIEGRHDLAASLAERALRTLQANEDERAVGLAHQMLAYIELERDNPGRALELLDEGAPIIERSADVTERAFFQLDRARALLALDQVDAARAVLQRIAPILTEQTRGAGSRCLLALAEAYDQIDENEDALLTYDLAIERLRDHRSPHLVRAYRKKSELLKRLGREAEAYEALKAAVDAQDVTYHGTRHAPSSPALGARKPIDNDK